MPTSTDARAAGGPPLSGDARDIARPGGQADASRPADPAPAGGLAVPPADTDDLRVYAPRTEAARPVGVSRAASPLLAWTVVLVACGEGSIAARIEAGDDPAADPGPDAAPPAPDAGPPPRVRLAAHALGPAAVDRFDHAFAAVASSGELGRLVLIHEQHGQHGLTHFLPWHRALLLAFEDTLREVDPGIATPYWDWLAEPALPPPGADPPPTLFDDDDEDPLQPVRDLDGTRLDAMARAVACAEEDTFDDFSTCLELAHNAVHNYVGGTMQALSRSPADPLFWLHHSFVDKLWVAWAAEHPDAAPPDADHPLAPWSETSLDVLDPAALGIDYR